MDRTLALVGRARVTSCLWIGIPGCRVARALFQLMDSLAVWEAPPDQETYPVGRLDGDATPVHPMPRWRVATLRLNENRRAPGVLVIRALLMVNAPRCECREERRLDDNFWRGIDERLRLQESCIRTDEELERIRVAELEAYSRNIEKIRPLITEFKRDLDARAFRTELRLDEKGFQFRYRRSGYYGPAGYRSELHPLGPLVLAVLNPGGSGFFKANDLDENIEVGEGFDAEAFVAFLHENLEAFLDPGNIITTEAQRERLRLAQGHNRTP